MIKFPVVEMWTESHNTKTKVHFLHIFVDRSDILLEASAQFTCCILQSSGVSPGPETAEKTKTHLVGSNRYNAAWKLRWRIKCLYVVLGDKTLNTNNKSAARRQECSPSTASQPEASWRLKHTNHFTVHGRGQLALSFPVSSLLQTNKMPNTRLQRRL